MRKTNEGRSPAGILLPSAAAGLLTTLFLMLVGAVFVQRGTLEEGLIAIRTIWALGAGMLVFLILLATGAALLDQPAHIVRIAISLLCALAASALGGLAGASMRKKKRYSHLKK